MFRICQIQYPTLHFMDRPVKTVAYLRVSTPQQDVGSQRLAILEYARKYDFRIDDFIEATASGQASEKRRRLDELTSVLGRGDRLVVSELSRLGRSLGRRWLVQAAQVDEGCSCDAERSFSSAARHFVMNSFGVTTRSAVRATRVPLGGAWAGSRRLFGVELADPPRRAPYSVILHESGRYP